MADSSAAEMLCLSVFVARWRLMLPIFPSFPVEGKGESDTVVWFAPKQSDAPTTLKKSLIFFLRTSYTKSFY